MKVIVISATSDIATEMCIKWKKRGWKVCGTYFSESGNYNQLQKEDIPLFFCDLLDENQIDHTAPLLGDCIEGWDVVIFAPGSQLPVGPFAKTNIDQWSSSVHLNFLNQIRMLHRLLPYKSKGEQEKSVLFFAGGGTNNTVANYSAYTISKIALIKMCELLDSEIKDVKFSIIGPGWVKTKIHDATLQAGSQEAGDNFEKTKIKLNSDECVPIDRVIQSFEWVISQPKNIVGGRNFSTVFDQWGSDELVDLLSSDENMYKLRRFGNNIVSKTGV